MIIHLMLLNSLMKYLKIKCPYSLPTKFAYLDVISLLNKTIKKYYEENVNAYYKFFFLYYCNNT